MANSERTIYIVDLHNTLYDEVLEYGSAVQAGLDTYLNSHPELDPQRLYQEMAQAHAKLGSDWHEGVWDAMPSLTRLANFAELKNAAIQARRKKSKEFTQKFVYPQALEFLRQRSDAGEAVYVATEATANAAADALRWLDLDGVVKAVYSWPYEGSWQRLERTQQKYFAAGLEKPSPRILAQIVLDEAKEQGLLPLAISMKEIFDFEFDAEMLIPSQLQERAKNHAQAQRAVAAMRERLVVREGAHAAKIRELLSRTTYVGDSHFRDGWMARNAGIRFIFAKYGKNIAPEHQAAFEKAREVLYAVTGWDKLTLQLTQEAGKAPGLAEAIPIEQTCEKSLLEYKNPTVARGGCVT